MLTWSVCLKKCSHVRNNPKKSYTEKKRNKQTPSGYSLFTNCAFDPTKNKLDCYRGEDCMEKFCEGLRGHAMKIINYEEKEMVPLIDKENKSYEKQKVCYICKKGISTDENDKNAFKLYRKVGDYCHYTAKFGRAAHNICNLRYKIPKDIPVVLHNGSTYDYHYIINKLAKEFYDHLECLVENPGKCITFSEPASKELDNGKTNTYRKSLLIALDLCRLHYQVVFIIYLKQFIVISVEIVNLSLIICHSNIIN